MAVSIGRCLPAGGADRGTVSPDPMDARTLLAWTPRRLPDGLAPAVAGLPVVEDVAEVIGGTAWLTGSSPAGFAIPVEVAAADPTAYARFVGPDVRSMLAEVERGAALLGRTSAGLRRSGPGGRIRFSTGDVPVVGVAADEEVGASEVFVSRETAAAIGVSTPRHLLIGPANGVERSTIVGALEALLPAGTALHTATHWEAPFLRYGHESLAPALMKAAMGEFAARPHDDGSLEVDPAWAPEHIAAASVPILGTVTCNRALAPQLAGALGDVADAGLAELVDPADYRGCYVPRFVGRNPAGSLSNHSWGAAVDLNASRNPFGQPPRMDPRVVAAFERWGFRWGGRWQIPDGMHFEFQRFPNI